MEWSPISERIILVRFKTKIRNLTIIQCYNQTETTGKDLKEKFYQQLYEKNNRSSKKRCNHGDRGYECQSWFKQ